MPSPRQDLGDRLRAFGGVTLTVFDEEPAQAPALPALVIRPGNPYREASILPHCLERWRLEVLALVPIDAVKPLDDLDALIELVRDVLRAMPQATYRGVRQAPAAVTIGAKSMRAAVVELDVDTDE